MNQQSEIEVMARRSEQLISAMTSALMTTMEVAADRLRLASEVSRIQQRLDAFSAVLDVIGAEKESIQAQLEVSKGASKSLLKRRLEMLTQQELTVLASAGVPDATATEAVQMADKPLFSPVNRLTNGQAVMPH